jgi:hypothetical protein
MSNSSDREPVLNLGHVAAWGAIVAHELTASGTRYTQMTRDNIIFSPASNRVRVVGGGSGILPIAWPSEARVHHDDIALFRTEFGSSLTSGLRLGYTYRLGPIGEWIFFEPDNGSAVLGPPPVVWSEEWDAPASELSLGNDCRLDSNEEAHIMQMGATYLRQGSLAAAKRCFMRCSLAAIAAGNEVAMAAALGNLAAVYLDERRWLRVLALAISAALFAGAMPNEGREWIGSLMYRARSHEPDAADQMNNAVTDGVRAGTTLTELLWRLEDFDIRGEIARTGGPIGS